MSRRVLSHRRRRFDRAARRPYPWVHARPPHRAGGGSKLGQYRTIPTLAEVLLVAQDRPWIEQHVRTGDGWTTAVAAGLDARLLLPSLGIELLLAEVYDKVPLGGYR